MPGPVTVKLVPLMDAGSIASLKVAVTLLFTATPVAPQRGTEAVTIGWGTLQLVQSEHAAMKSTSGNNANNHNHFALTLYLRIACVLRVFIAHCWTVSKEVTGRMVNSAHPQIKHLFSLSKMGIVKAELWDRAWRNGRPHGDVIEGLEQE